jgi:WhiB family transcriptional regulator, redox-sensing transcriptional regulator
VCLTDVYTATQAQGARDGMDEDSAWMEQGLCRDKAPAAFFPHDGSGVETARQICKECGVKDQCLEYALENRIDHGVWGGCSERERRRILKRRRQLALAGG